MRLRGKGGECGITGSIIALLIAFAPAAVRLFSPDSEVIRFGVLDRKSVV